MNLGYISRRGEEWKKSKQAGRHLFNRLGQRQWWAMTENMQNSKTTSHSQHCVDDLCLERSSAVIIRQDLSKYKVSTKSQKIIAEENILVMGKK